MSERRTTACAYSMNYATLFSARVLCKEADKEQRPHEITGLVNERSTCSIENITVDSVDRSCAAAAPSECGACCPMVACVAHLIKYSLLACCALADFECFKRGLTTRVKSTRKKFAHVRSALHAMVVGNDETKGVNRVV